MIENTFVLTYHTNLNKKDIEEMSLFELDTWLELLTKQKEIEHESQNKEVK